MSREGSNGMVNTERLRSGLVLRAGSPSAVLGRFGPIPVLHGGSPANSRIGPPSSSRERRSPRTTRTGAERVRPRVQLLPLAVIADRSAGRGWTVLTSGRGRRRMRPARSRLRRSVCGVPRTIGRPSARWRSRSANAGTSPASGPRRGRRAAVRAPPIHRPGHPGGPAPGTRRRSGRPIDFINVQRASHSWMLLRIAGIGSLITTKRNEVRTLPEFRSGS